MLGAVLFITFKDYTYISLLILLILNKHWGTLILFIHFIFIFGCAGSLRLRGLFSSCNEWRYSLVCGMRTSPCGGFSCCGPWALEHAGVSSSSVVAHSREGNGTPLQYSCLENPMDGGAWWATVHGVAKSRTRLSDFTFTFHFHTMEKAMAAHSSVLAWRIPGMGEPGGLLSLGSHRVGHDWSDLAAAAAVAHRLSNYGAHASLLWGMWDLPGPGIKPEFPPLAGRFFTTEPQESLWGTLLWKVEQCKSRPVLYLNK